MPDVPADAAVMTAWIDTDDEGNETLHTVVEGEERVYEDIESDLGIALENQQYVGQFERPSLALLTLHYRLQDEAAEADTGTTDAAVDAEAGARVEDPVAED